MYCAFDVRSFVRHSTRRGREFDSSFVRSIVRRYEAAITLNEFCRKLKHTGDESVQREGKGVFTNYKFIDSREHFYLIATCTRWYINVQVEFSSRRDLSCSAPCSQCHRDRAPKSMSTTSSFPISFQFRRVLRLTAVHWLGRCYAFLPSLTLLCASASVSSMTNGASKKIEW